MDVGKKTHATLMENRADRLDWRSRLDNVLDRYAPYWLMLPALGIIAAILLYPLLHAFYISFFDYRLARSARPFIGLDNYVAAATSYSFLFVLVQKPVYLR